MTMYTVQLLSKPFFRHNRAHWLAQVTRYRPAIHHTPIRSETSGGDNKADEQEQEDPVFGVLRKRVLDRVGDNLDQIMKYNAFELFGIQQQFKVNNYQLQQEMRKLQRILHPDRFVNAKKTSQEKSDYLSAAVNDFYTILTNPYERGKYLLSLVTKKSPSDIEKSLDELKVDDRFLARMMEMREKIEDPSCDSLELQKVNSALENEMNDLIAQLDRDFKSGDTNAILEKLGKLKFLVNCHHVLSDKCDAFSRF